MSDLRPNLIPDAPWRARFALWRKAVVGALAPQGATLLQLSSEEVALILRKARDGEKVDTTL